MHLSIIGVIAYGRSLYRVVMFVISIYLLSILPPSSRSMTRRTAKLSALTHQQRARKQYGDTRLPISALTVIASFAARETARTATTVTAFCASAEALLRCDAHSASRTGSRDVRAKQEAMF